MTTPTAPADDITLPALDPLREAERAKRVCTTLMRIARDVDGLTVMERIRIGEAIGLVQRSVQLLNAAKGPANQQPEPDISEKERRRREAFDTLPDDYEVN